MNYHRGMSRTGIGGTAVGKIDTEKIIRCARCPQVVMSPRPTTKYPVCADCYAVRMLEQMILRAEADGIDVAGMSDEEFDRFSTDEPYRRWLKREARKERDRGHALAA